MCNHDIKQILPYCLVLFLKKRERERGENHIKWERN